MVELNEYPPEIQEKYEKCCDPHILNEMGPDFDAEQFTRGAVCNPNDYANWIKRGLLEPSTSPGRGRGRRRYYSLIDMWQGCLVGALARHMPLKAAVQIIRNEAPNLQDEFWTNRKSEERSRLLLYRSTWKVKPYVVVRCKGDKEFHKACVSTGGAYVVLDVTQLLSEIEGFLASEIATGKHDQRKLNDERL